MCLVIDRSGMSFYRPSYRERVNLGKAETSIIQVLMEERDIPRWTIEDRIEKRTDKPIPWAKSPSDQQMRDWLAHLETLKIVQSDSPQGTLVYRLTDLFTYHLQEDHRHMFELNNDGTSQAVGLGDDIKAVTPFDIVPTSILIALAQMGEAKVPAISTALEVAGKNWVSDAVVYQALDRLLAKGAVAKRVEPIKINDQEITQIFWRLSDRLGKSVKESFHVVAR